MTDLFNYFKERLQSNFKVSQERFNSDFNQWAEKRGVSIQSKNDFIWSVLNRLVFEAGATKSGFELYKVLRPIYSEMCVYLLKEGRSTYSVHKLLLYCDLYFAQDSRMKMQAVLIASKCCPECDKVDGMIMPLEKALESQPLPVEACTKKIGCSCCYGFHGERDNNGRLILN